MGRARVARTVACETGRWAADHTDDAVSFDRPWVLAFRNKLAALGFQYQDEGDPCFRNEKNVPMYLLLFFSKDIAGLRIWRGIKKIEPGGQRTLL
jgi:hypothetical protein